MKKSIILTLALVALTTLLIGNINADECPSFWWQSGWTPAYGTHPNNVGIAWDRAEQNAQDACLAVCSAPECMCIYEDQGCVWIPPQGFILGHYRCQMDWARCEFHGK